MNKMNKIKFITSLFLILVFTQFASASYSVIFNLDRSGWDYEQYYCGSDTWCVSPSYIGGGYESSNSHTFTYSSTSVNAAYFYETCYRPLAGRWWGAGYGYVFTGTFVKKNDCSSTFNSLTISDSNPFIGDTIQVYPNINSAFTIHDDDPITPVYCPPSHNQWWTSDITVSAVVKDPISDVVMTLPSQVASIYQDDSESLTFDIDTSSFTMPGTYTVEVKTQASDCICDQINDIIKTQIVQFRF